MLEEILFISDSGESSGTRVFTDSSQGIIGLVFSEDFTEPEGSTCWPYDTCCLDTCISILSACNLLSGSYMAISIGWSNDRWNR